MVDDEVFHYFFEDFTSSHFALNISQEIIAKVDWVSWVNNAGYPLTYLNITNELAKNVTDMAD